MRRIFCLLFVLCLLTGCSTKPPEVPPAEELSSAAVSPEPPAEPLPEPAPPAPDVPAAPAELEIVPEGGFFKNRFGNLLRGTILGHGVVPVIECIRLLRQSGYDEGFTLEFEGAEDNLPAIEASYAYMRKLAALPLERA